MLVCVGASECVCVCVRMRTLVYIYALRLVSPDKSLRFTNTLIITINPWMHVISKYGQMK